MTTHLIQLWWQLVAHVYTLAVGKGLFHLVGGRRHDFTPYTCTSCGCVRPSRWLKHMYGRARDHYGESDVSYTAKCPRCDATMFEH